METRARATADSGTSDQEFTKDPEVFVGLFPRITLRTRLPLHLSKGKAQVRNRVING